MFYLLNYANEWSMFFMLELGGDLFKLKLSHSVLGVSVKYQLRNQLLFSGINRGCNCL